MAAGAKKDRRQPQRAAAPSNIIADSAYVARRVERHLTDLERTNYTEPTTGPSAYGDGDDDSKGPSALADEKDAAGRKKKKSMAVRSLLMYRKNLSTLLNEADLSSLPKGQPTYLTVAAPPSKRPPLQLCSVCGYKGRYACLRCGVKYCDVGCKTTHDESRCERR
ncbi:hypothetical protein JCM10207_006835 [Rhodosporidiobolus poonsookiae]